jgi:hypothetical protein
MARYDPPPPQPKDLRYEHLLCGQGCVTTIDGYGAIVEWRVSGNTERSCFSPSATKLTRRLANSPTCRCDQLAVTGHRTKG